jgi:hypothetical protein
VLKIRFLFFVVILSSCSFFEKKEAKYAVAKVGENYLYLSDLEGVVPKGTSEEDSVKMVKLLIENWVKQELLLQKAAFNLGDLYDEISKDVENYRKSKIIYAYEKEVVNQLLDTVISENEIKAYYESNKSNFELKDYIIQCLYLKIANNSPDIKLVQEWIKSDDPIDRAKFDEYCYKYGVKFFLNEEEWLYFDDIIKEMHLELFNVKDFLEKNKFIEKQDDNFIYLLKISNYVLKDDISPLSLQKKNIKNIIINQRKIELIKKMHKDIYQEALEKGKFEIYE